MKPMFARPERRTASAMGGRADTRALWRRLAQAILAVFCLVAAARAGLPAGDATLLVGSVADEATRADASLDQGRKLLRPDRKSTRLNSSHLGISYAVFCLKKKKM